MVEILDSRVQAQKFLCTFPPLESLLLSSLTPYGTVGLLNQVITAGCGNHLLVVDIDEARNFSDRSSVTPQLVGMNDLRDIVFIQETSQEGLCNFRITVPLKQDIEHKTVLVGRSAESGADAIDARTLLVQLRKTVVLRLGLGHGGSAYPNSIKAT